jgi:hypothetical protein
MNMKHFNQSKKNLVTMCDPPEGWKYGFPKPMPNNVENFEEWLRSEGYPVDKSHDRMSVLGRRRRRCGIKFRWTD